MLVFVRVVVVDDVCHVTHAAIADFYIIPVKQLVEGACFREMFVDRAKE